MEPSSMTSTTSKATIHQVRTFNSTESEASYLPLKTKFPKIFTQCLHAMVWGLLDFDFQLPHTKSEHFSAQFQPEESIDESSHQSEQKRCSFEARLEVFHKFSCA